MALKLTKKESNQKHAFVTTLRNIETDVAALLTKGPAVIDVINARVEKYNECLEDATSFVEEIASRLRDEFDEKSEKWQESERGSEIGEFIYEWENVSLDTADKIDEADFTTYEFPSYSDDLENLTEEV
jgi:phosphosulfolactate phosphohydrolase-like enzyme